MKSMKMLMIGVSVFLALLCFASDETKVNNSEAFRKRIVSLIKQESLDVKILHGTIQDFNLSEEDARSELYSLARQYKNASDDFSGGRTDVQRNSDSCYCGWILLVLSNSGDTKNLPFFEEMAISTNDMVRFNGYMAYVRVAGIDAMQFIDKITKIPCFNGLDEYRIYRMFGEQIKKAKNEIPDKDLSKQYTYLVDKAIRGEIRGDILDKVLCDILPEYSTSVQRAMAAEAMLKSENDFLRGMGNSIKAEIEKTPKEKRKDFKAKGELLDPDRDK